MPYADIVYTKTDETNNIDPLIYGLQSPILKTVGSSSNCDYITDGVADDVQINQAITDVSVLGGGTVIIKTNVTISNTIILKSKVLLTSPAKGSVIITLANNSNCDILKTYNFDTYTNTGNTTGLFGYGEISNLIFNGNKINQTSGNGLRIYNVAYSLKDIVVSNVKQVGIYSEYSSTDIQPTNLPHGYIESSWDNISIDSCGSHGVEYRGPHDSKLTKIISSRNGGRGFYLTGDVNQGVGGVKLSQCQAWANLGEALRVGDSSTSNVSIEAFDCQFDGTVATGDAAVIETALNLFSGCKFYGGSATGSATNIKFNSNSFYNCEWYQAKYGIRLGTASNAITTCIITGKIYLNSTTATAPLYAILNENSGTSENTIELTGYSFNDTYALFSGIDPTLNNTVKFNVANITGLESSMGAKRIYADKIYPKSGSIVTHYYDLAMAGYKITGAGNPTAAQDVSTKNYVDTTAVLLAGTQTITGVKTFQPGNNSTVFKKSAGQTANIWRVEDENGNWYFYATPQGNLQFDSGRELITDQGTATAVAGAVTLNRQGGLITTEALTTAAGSTYTLTITDSQVTANSVIMATVTNGTNTTGTPELKLGLTRVSPSTIVLQVLNSHTTNSFNGTLKIAFTKLN